MQEVAVSETYRNALIIHHLTVAQVNNTNLLKIYRC